MKANYRVVVTDDRHAGDYEIERNILAEAGARLEVANLESHDQACLALASADAVLCNLFPMDRALIGTLANCRVISRYGIGYDNVDVEAATDAGIWVSRVPDYAAEDTSDHTMALILDLVRKISYRDQRVRRGKWNIPSPWTTFRMRGKTIGIIGFGAVGRAVYRKLAGFEPGRVLVYDPGLTPEFIKAKGAEPVDFARLIAESDIVTIHAPLVDATRHLFDDAAFGAIKHGSLLVNTARGPLVDTQALLRALESGRLAAAALDVYEEEPPRGLQTLKRLPNLIMTDHCGYYSQESIRELKTKAAMNVVCVLQGKEPIYPVNRVLQGATRVVHQL